VAYETTTVPVEKSQSDLRKLLRGYGAEGYQFGEVTRAGTTWASVQFAHEGYMVRMRVPLKPPDTEELRKRAKRARTKTLENLYEEATDQEARRVWRVLYWNLKSRMEAVEEEVETFLEAFLAHVVNQATGRTVYEELSEEGRVELADPLPRLALPGGEDS
jgi:hypothetical protein